MYRWEQRFGFVALMAVFSASAQALTFAYPADCAGSYSKQGDKSEDLQKQAGQPVTCDTAIVSQLDNGNVMVQVANKTSSVTPLGFGGSQWNHEINPNFVSVPIERIYLPHMSNPGNSQVVSGVDGFCFLDGKLNLLQLSSISCAAKMEIGMQRLVYHVDVTIKGQGKVIPGF